MVIHYVCGFAFSPTKVALIRKTKPEWQAGRLNGIGGKVEGGETHIEAMIREFEEETGCHVEDWEVFVTLQSPPGWKNAWSVYFFRAFGVDLTKLKSVTEEEVVVVPWLDLPSSVIHNLRWLIPLASDLDIEIPVQIHDLSTF